MKHYLITAWLGLLVAAGAHAQNYHAVQGSSFAGALGVSNNPASIVNTAFKWDVVLVGTQVQSSTNAFSIHNYSLLSSPANSLYHIDDGTYARKSRLDFNLNLLNGRIALNRKSSIAFGANIRSYSNLLTSAYNYNDTLNNATDFLKINQGLNNINAKLFSSSWFEGYLSYARTLSDNEFGRLNAGITVKVNKGLSGANVNLDNVSFSQSRQNNATSYSINTAGIVYGYSSNYDRINSAGSSNQNVKDFIGTTQGGASFDAGFEYLVKPQGTTSFNDEDDYYDYDWKLGVSVLDVGGSQYRYGLQSRSIAASKINIEGLALDNKFDASVNSFQKFNDSLGTLVSSNNLPGKFIVVHPTRLVVNIDHYLTGNFYINGELSMNVPLASIKKTYLQVKEMNLLTVTPRWETKRYGFYLPVQYNNQNKLWVGGAFKAGPLLFGLHNLVNLFGKTSVQNGGGYVALIIRAPRGGSGSKTDKRLDCPKPVW